jgi:predicted O-methyltransferase YrrM
MDADAQRRAVESVEPLPGWLLDDDARKLYELAHDAEAPGLEIGTYRGKSAILMATALRDAGRPGPIVSLDVDRDGLDAAHAEASARGLADRIAFVHGTAEALFRSRPDLVPAFVFLDGDHSRRGVARDLRALEPRVPRGGILLFHDFHDERNADPAEPDYGVTEAIEASWVARECQFGGVFGACGLYRRETGGPATPRADMMGVGEVTDLGREPLASWIERRVLGGIARRAGALRARR